VSKLGDQLRTQREKKGITLDQAAADTRIREKFLKALEDGDYQSLPGAVYTKGFLRNYAEYLDLDQEELVVLFHQERGLPIEAARYRPMRPIMRRSLIFTPAVLVPVIVLAGIVLFVGYLFYQFTSFAVAPALDVTDPPTDAIVQDTQFVLRGRTVASGRVTVTLYPGGITVADVHPASDGTFSVPITLTPASTNHITVDVLDQTGKQSSVTRTIIVQPQVAVSAAPVKLIVDAPANGARFENTSVTVSGTTDGTVTVNGAATPVTNGRFEARLAFPAGQQTVTIVARNTSGASITEIRTVAVAYTTAIVQVAVKGADAWVEANVDGTAVPGRVYKDGESATFTGKRVVLRSGNAAATQVTYNGQFQGTLGPQGQVVEKVYTAQ
jgi:cytoskeletal protein RodZ